MGLIKKKFKLNPETTSTYNLNILLTENVVDIGFFDTLDDTEFVGSVSYIDAPNDYVFVNSYDFLNHTGDTFFNEVYTVTGNCPSRLSELAKFSISNDLSIKYFLSSVLGYDGLDLSKSDTGATSGNYVYTYYLGGIQYVDSTPLGSTATTTTFSFESNGYSLNNFDNKRIVKLPSKENMVENGQVNSDVFIIRQQQSVFEKNYRLRAVNGLNDTLTYAGGNYFRIYNNT